MAPGARHFQQVGRKDLFTLSLLLSFVTHGATGSPIAIHRTFLAHEGGQSAAPALVEITSALFRSYSEVNEQPHDHPLRLLPFDADQYFATTAVGPNL